MKSEDDEAGRLIAKIPSSHKLPHRPAGLEKKPYAQQDNLYFIQLSLYLDNLEEKNLYGTICKDFYSAIASSFCRNLVIKSFFLGVEVTQVPIYVEGW